MDRRPAETSRIDRIEIRSPCTALWTEMKGDDRARFCMLCRKTVYDSMALESCELEGLLDQKGGACVRVHRDAAGLVLTRDRMARAAMVAGVAALAACGGAGQDSRETGDTLFGGETASQTIAEVTGARSVHTWQNTVPDAPIAELGEPALPLRLPPPPTREPLMGKPAMMMGGMTAPSLGSIAPIEENHPMMGDIAAPNED